MNSLRVLLTSLIDYAGLFPPAKLDMKTAVGHYAAYRQSEYAWMLGRFIVPAARLDEFAREAAAYWVPERGEKSWGLSVLSGFQLDEDINKIMDFNMRHPESAFIDAIEIKAERVEDIERAMHSMPGLLAAYFEIPIADDPGELIAAMARTGARAKVRTGGLTPETIPTTTDLARFIGQCAAANVRFKATAGLHHSIRSVHRLTDEPDSPSGLMHGFLNVFLAGAFLRHGMSLDTATRLLDESSGEAFQFDDEGVAWRERRLTTDQLGRARQSFSVAFGSCSFEEPIGDLKAAGLL
jgi:hypothetical protein